MNNRFIFIYVLNPKGLLLSFEKRQDLLFQFGDLSGLGMFAERKVEKSVPFEHRLRVCKLAKTPFAVVSSHTRMTRTVKRHTFDHHMNTHLVDTTAAELLGLHHAVCPFHVFREYIHR